MKTKIALYIISLIMMLCGSAFIYRIIENSIWTIMHAQSVATTIVVIWGCTTLSLIGLTIALLGAFLLYVAFKLPRMS